MKSDFEEQFLDYLEQRLSVSQRERFESALENDAELARSFDAYRRVLRAERILARERFSLPDSFTAELNLKLAGRGPSQDRLNIWRWIGSVFGTAPRMGALATLAAALVGVVLFVEHGSVPIGMTPRTKVSETSEFKQEIANLARQSDALIREEEPPLKMDARKDQVQDAKPSAAGESRAQNLPILKESVEVEERSNSLATLQKKKSVAATALQQAPPAAPASALGSTLESASSDFASAGGAADEAQLRRSPTQESVGAKVDNYTVVERYILGGALPPPELVRVDEFVGHFKDLEPKEKGAAASARFRTEPGGIPIVVVAAGFAKILARDFAVGDELEELQRLEQALDKDPELAHDRFGRGLMVLIKKAKTLYESR